MKYEDLKSFWYDEENNAFCGWDFSHLDYRWNSEPEKWDYKGLVKDYLKSSYQLLDMGTGGGEFLLSLNHPYENTSVTEAWEPNVKLCKEKLGPLGIKVYPVLNNLLPMEENKFDIVINRHASYDIREVSRVLKSGGMFITQQVGSENSTAFAERLNPKHLPAYEDFSLSTELPKFNANGFCVKYSNECYPELRFFDVGAVVFWAKIIKWTFPYFSVDNNYQQLCCLQDEILQKGYVSAVQHRLILVAENLK